MISEQIMEDYLEIENDHQQWMKKLKFAILAISLAGLIIFSL